jgi:pyruvate dehydrogenase E2 component (dihydrolipoamide acetyltransferase)
MAKTSIRRKLAIATWSAPREGNIYGKLTLDAGPALAYLEHLRATTGEKVTLTHLVGRAVAEALKQAPTLNGRVVFGGFRPFPSVAVSFLVSLEDGNDLAKAKVEHADSKSVLDIARELRALAERLRGGKDKAFEGQKGLVRLMPSWLLRPLVWLTGFLTSGLGLSVLGLEAYPFGACIVTSVGMFGLDEGFAPPTPFARVPLYVLVGAVRERPAVEEGALVIRKEVTLCATVDHRFIDGHQGAVLARVIRRAFEEPWSLDGVETAPMKVPEPALLAAG